MLWHEITCANLDCIILSAHIGGWSSIHQQGSIYPLWRHQFGMVTNNKPYAMFDTICYLVTCYVSVAFVILHSVTYRSYLHVSLYNRIIFRCAAHGVSQRSMPCKTSLVKTCKTDVSAKLSSGSTCQWYGLAMFFNDKKCRKWKEMNIHYKRNKTWT